MFTWADSEDNPRAPSAAPSSRSSSPKAVPSEETLEKRLLDRQSEYKKEQTDSVHTDRRTLGVALEYLLARKSPECVAQKVRNLL